MTDARGPLAGTLVQADSQWKAPDGWMEGDARVTTDSQGQFELTLNGPGRYRLAAEQDGGRTVPVEIDADWDQEQRVDLRFGGGVLQGVVLDAATGLPLAGAQLTLRSFAEGAVAKNGKGALHRATTGADGRFVATRLDAGRWSVSVRRDGYVAPPAQEADVPAAGAAPELTLALQLAGSVRGVLRPPPGGSLPSKLRAAFAPLDVVAGKLTAQVGPEGVFVRDGLAPGRWSCEIVSSEPGDSQVYAVRDVLVLAGETVELELSLPE